MLYFAYGSNMSADRLKKRINSACKVGIGELKDYKLVCNKTSKKDESLKFNIECSEGSQVYGVVYCVSESDLPELDKFEGALHGNKHYIREMMTIIYNGEEQQAATYICTCTENIDNSGENKPYSWYVEHALRGAREAGIDHDYIERYINIASKEDQNKSRASGELEIYSHP